MTSTEQGRVIAIARTVRTFRIPWSDGYAIALSQFSPVARAGVLSAMATAIANPETKTRNPGESK
jgi:deoxycytidine triphosphate deaminase